MKHKLQIGVQNFRVFKEMTTFEIRPLTILIGPNNSGKSSFTKLLLLLKNGFDPLEFEKGEHYLGSYNKALNWDSGSKEMVLQKSWEFTFFPDTFIEQFRYHETGELKERQIINTSNGMVLLKVRFGAVGSSWEEDDEALNTLPNKNIIRLFLDINYFIELLYQNALVIERNVNTRVLTNHLDSIEKDYLLYDLFVNGKKITNDTGIKKLLLEYQDLFYSNYEAVYYPPNPDDYSLHHLLTYLNQNVKDKMKSALKHQFDKNDNLELIESTLGRLIFTDILVSDPKIERIAPDIYSQSLFDRFKLTSTKSNIYGNVEYLPANRGKQERVLQIHLNDKNYKIVADFEKHNKQTNDDFYDYQRYLISLETGYSIHGLIRDILDIIGITGEVSIKTHENSVASVYIKTKDSEINLADYGFGYSQLIPIILKIFNMAVDGKPDAILIIEEPEANLHPSLQSKLADIFTLVLTHLPYLKIIVETHSEYLIRKLQYLVATKKVTPGKIGINYFNMSKPINGKRNFDTYEIDIENDGRLSREFGSGFFDEADNLAIELFLLHNTQDN